MRERVTFAIALLALVMIVTPVAMANTTETPRDAVVTYPTKIGLSIPLRDVPPTEVTPQDPRQVPIKPRRETPGLYRPDPGMVDTAVQNYHGAAGPMPPPIQNFEGQSDADNIDVLGFAIVPPDTNGDVGPNHYVQWINLVFSVYDKSGTQILGPIAGTDIFTGFGGICENDNAGDPTVLYDQFADRWVISQFGNPIGAGAVQCVAVSTTPDPTGTYHLYEFPTPGNDYPKMGVWPDGYYMTYRNFAGGDFIQFVALERDEMLTGGAAAHVRIGIPDAGGDFYEGVLPPHVEGITPPPAGSPAPFVMLFDDEWDGVPVAGEDSVKIWEFAVDWTNPGNSTVTGPTTVSMPEFDRNFCNTFFGCINQPAPGETLHALSSFTMWRLVYHGLTNTLWANATADIGGDEAGIRWVEIGDPFGTPNVLQAGTYAPADGADRWTGSLAVDDGGNMALGYNTSSTSIFPSVRYAGRLVSDPPGVLDQTEVEMWAGTGAQTSSSSRWGDYSSMSLDESDGCTFWFTTEYYETTGSFDFKTRIGSFAFPTCSAAATGTLQGTVTNLNTGNPIEGANIEAAGGGTFSTSTDANGDYSMLLPADTYDVTASAFGFSSETVNSVVVGEDATVIVDFALEPGGSVEVDGFVTAASAGWPLYAEVVIEPDGGMPVTLFTDPLTGYYSHEVLAGANYTFSVTPMDPNFQPEVRPVTTDVVDFQENFALNPTGSCVVPGYEVTATELTSSDFTTFPPAGWTVNNTTSACGSIPEWNNLDPGGRGNLTGGSGAFAVADSDVCGSGVSMNTQMISPAFDLSGADALQIEWKHDYRDLGSTANVDVWNGSSWVNVAAFGGADDRGPVTRMVNTGVGAGVGAAQVRWHYVAGWDWWWEVDDVVISSVQCDYTGGWGIIFGNVTDENNGMAVDGATVALDTGQSTTTVATGDPNVGDGFYVIYAPMSSAGPGLRTVTVSKDGYGTVEQEVVVQPNGARELDFVLPAGMLGAAPDELRNRLPINGAGDLNLALSNTGGLEVNFEVVEFNSPAPAAFSGPFDQPTYPWTPGDRVAMKERHEATLAPTSQGLPRPDPPAEGRELLAAGDHVSDFPSGLVLPWAAGYDVDADTVWIGDPAAGGGDDLNHEFELDGTATGSTMVGNHGGVFAADMAFNVNTGMLWQVDVGGDDCIHELDPVNEVATGNTICPAFGISQRGLAHDPATDTFYAGSWNDLMIHQFDATGAFIRQVNVGLSVSGLAYNPESQHLFVQVNAAPQAVFVLDASQPNLPQLGSFTLKDSGGGNAFGDFSGGGLEMDCDGNLIAPNQTTGVVFINESGEGGFCEVDIPWFDAVPKTGAIAPAASVDVAAMFDAAGMPPSCPEAHVKIDNDTPYGTPTLPTGLTVEFNDVPAGTFADHFIHGIAHEQISLGCGVGNFCPDTNITRAAMAVWVVRANWGIDFAPPPATGLIFDDVGPEDFAADEIEFLYNEGIVAGCGGGNYCPTNPVTRKQMSVFLLATLEGVGYTPPACTGIFDDVDCPSPFADWIEELFNRGITAGCGTDPLRYCPDDAVTRAQMSVFTVATWDLTVCLQ